LVEISPATAEVLYINTIAAEQQARDKLAKAEYRAIVSNTVNIFDAIFSRPTPLLEVSQERATFMSWRFAAADDLENV